MEFLRAAFAVSRHSVYSLHKTSTRDYIQKLALRELRAQSGAGRAAGHAQRRLAGRHALQSTAGRAPACTPVLTAAPPWPPAPPAAEVLAQLRYDLPATFKFHKCVGRGWGAGREPASRWALVDALPAAHLCSLLLSHTTACRQKSRDIEVDLWRFEVPPRTDS